MANRIFIVDVDTTGDTVRFVQRQSLPQTIAGLAAGSWIVHNTNQSSPIIVEGAEPQIRPASLIGNRSVHSGHSLTDAYLAWGYLSQIRDDIFGENTPEYKLGKSTTPGSPLHWRWDGVSEPVDERRDAPNFETLVITEGGPPPQHDAMQEWEMPPSLDFLCRFAANQILEGADDEVILWSIWPALNGPGTSPEQPTPTGAWAGYTFRTGCDEYWRSFKCMADYATWKIKRLYPSLRSDWRVWFFPGDRWMAQAYDDIQASQFPGITAIDQIFDDDIHPNQIGIYGLACFMATCLYQVDLREIEDLYVPTEFVTQAQAEYFWQLAWDLANRFEHIGMGGTEGMEAVWRPLLGDPLPEWTYEGAVDPEEPEEPTDPSAVLPASGVLLGAHAGGVYGTAALASVQYLAPMVSGGAIVAPATDNGLRIPYAVNGRENVYFAMRASYEAQPGSGPFALMALRGGEHGYSSPNLQVVYNGGVRNFIAQVGYAGGSKESYTAPNFGNVNANPFTIETRFEDGQVGIVANNGANFNAVGAADPEREIGDFNHIFLGGGQALRIHAFVIMDRWPTEAERAGIQAWLASPSGGAPMEVPQGSLPSTNLVLGAWAGGIQGAAASAGRTRLGQMVEGNVLSSPANTNDAAPNFPYTFTPSAVYMAVRAAYKTTSPGGVHQVIAARAGDQSYNNPGVELACNPGVRSAFAGIANGGNSTTAYANPGFTNDVGTTPFVIEGRITPGQVATALNNRPFDAAQTTEAALAPYSHIQLGGGWNTAGLDIHAMVIMDRIPTEAERVAIQLWLNSPSGGTAY